MDKRRAGLIWLAEFGVGVIIHLVYCLMKFGTVNLDMAIRLSLYFYIPSVLLYFFRNKIEEDVIQFLWVISVNFYILTYATYVHSYSLITMAFLTSSVFFTPILKSKIMKFNWMLSSILTIFSIIIVVLDRGYLRSSTFEMFIISSGVSLFATGVLTFMVCAAEEGRHDLEQKTQDAIDANRSKSTFLANMSHEIRTPMNAILGMSEILMLSDEFQNDREYVVTIHNSAKSLLNIINDILDFSKIDAEKLELIEEQYDLESMVLDVENIIETRLKDKSVSFIVELSPDLPSRLCGDDLRIKQILINVLGNSVKHTNKGRIFLGIFMTKYSNNKVRLEFVIEDTGAGIPEKDIDNLFEAFSQADTKRNRNIEGTGLGLAITKRLAEAMGGDIKIESEYGKGTKVTVTILQEIVDETPWVSLEEPEKYQVYICEPNRYYQESLSNICGMLKVDANPIRNLGKLRYTVKDEDGCVVFYNYDQCYDEIALIKDKYTKTKFVAMFGMYEQMNVSARNLETLVRPVGISKVAAILERRGRAYEEEVEEHELFFAPTAKVLVVDDNAVNLKVAGGMLSLYGIQAFFASSGMECIRLFEEGKRFDIIFMDHMMPQLDGVETTQMIRERERKNKEHNTIIALTANAIKGVEKMFLESGMDDYISKPIELSALERMLRKWLDESKLEVKQDVAKTDSSQEQEKKQELEQKEDNIQDIKEEELKEMSTWKHFDVEDGIEQVGGMKEVYFDVLEMVLEEGEEKRKLIPELYEKKDYVNYEIEVHALKSAMASVGAKDLSALAKEHEFAVKEDRLSYIDEHIEELLELYDDVLRETKEILEQG